MQPVAIPENRSGNHQISLVDPTAKGPFMFLFQNHTQCSTNHDCGYIILHGIFTGRTQGLPRMHCVSGTTFPLTTLEKTHTKP